MQVRRKHGLAVGAVVVAVLVAAPAIGANGSDRSGQPPPGTVAHSAVNAARVTAQPSRVTHAPLKLAPVPKQPVNRHPEKAGKSLTVLRHSKGDKGKKGLKVQKDHGKKHLPIQRG
jgi:hypothetical protein